MRMPLLLMRTPPPPPHAQVRAMEARAVSIGKPRFFYYLSPNNANWLNASQARPPPVQASANRPRPLSRPALCLPPTLQRHR